MSNERLAATLIVSFDVELGWGSIENGTWFKKEAAGTYVRVRPALCSLLSVLEDMGVPATWAFVGKLLDPHNLEKATLPPEILEVCRMNGKETTWRGDDLLEKIRSSSIEHEIACHSFYHRRCGTPSMSADEFAEELTDCRQVFALHGLSPTSFVYPSNEERWVEILPEKDFTAFRGQNRFELLESKRRGVRKTVSLLRLCGFWPLRSENPSLMLRGLWRIPGTVLFNVAPKRKDFLPGLVRRVMTGLRKAAKRGGYIHLWSHPYNFAVNPQLIDAFRDVLGQVVKMRDAGQIRILTMEKFVRSQEDSGKSD